MISNWPFQWIFKTKRSSRRVLDTVWLIGYNIGHGSNNKKNYFFGDFFSADFWQEISQKFVFRSLL